MKLKEKNVLLRTLTADEGKIIVSKETKLNEEGNEIPVVRSKEIYLGNNDSEENYEEIDEAEVDNKESEE